MPAHRTLARACATPGRRVALAVLAVAVTGCSGEHNVLDPEGPGAERIADIGWVMFGMSAAVTVLYVGALLVALARRRRGADRPARFSESAWVVAGGVALPLVTIAVLTPMSLAVLADDEPGEVRVEATGNQYWWEIRYPDHGFTTANELRIPVGRPVHFTLRSHDVIHSWWVPDLGPKIDMVPGNENDVVLQADESGVYRGQCAEYCGIQHAHMVFYVTAVEEDEFEDWVAHMRQPAAEPDTEGEVAGLAAFLELPCAACHTIRGTAAHGDLGPELTHFASRRTIGAGTVPNTEGHLGGWIVNSQTLKPGNLMPPIAMTPGELQALLAYLGSLE